MTISVLTKKIELSTILLIGMLLLHIFFQMFNTEQRNTYGWDQVNNAWAAKDILVDHKYPLVGMVAKGNSGFYIGPAYYYFVAFFYSLTKLDPLASSFIAGITSICTFLVLFFVIRKLFSQKIAFVSILIYTTSLFIINADRVQWPVNFIPSFSLLIFYALYNVILGKERFIFITALLVGLSFHIHFTSVFYPIIIVLSLPFFPRTRKMLLYIVYAIPIFFLFLVPNFIFDTLSKGSSSKNATHYIETYYHGFHVRRVFQLAHDAFIEFESILGFHILRMAKFIFVPLFYVFYLKKNISRERVMLCYLIALWFIVPWFVFAVYRGEISNYYFAMTRPIVILILAYISVKIFELKHILPKILISIFWVYYIAFNVFSFVTFPIEHNALSSHRSVVQAAIKSGTVIDFTEGDAKSYLYYIQTKK